MIKKRLLCMFHKIHIIRKLYTIAYLNIMSMNIASVKVKPIADLSKSLLIAQCPHSQQHLGLDRYFASSFTLQPFPNFIHQFLEWTYKYK